MNLSGSDFNLGFNTDGGSKLYDVYDGKTAYDVNGNYVNIHIPAHGTRVLVLTNGDAPEYPDSADTAVAVEKPEEYSESVQSDDVKPLPEIGKPGIYRHFKGGEYEFICLAKDSETSEELVIYKETGDEGKIWARPSAIFYQYVDVDGKRIPRFELVSDK